jgi:hypothetical protein
MTYLLLSFLAGAFIGGIFMYHKGKRDGLQLLSDEILEDVKRRDHRTEANRVRRAKKHLRCLI